MARSEIEIDVFGDESVGNEVVAYGLLVVPLAQLFKAEALLQKVKADFGGTPQHRLHCREMFAGDARSKSSWAHLRIDDVFSLYERLARDISCAGLRRIVCVARRSHFPNRLLAEDAWPEISLGAKQLAAYCGNAAMIPLSKSPGLDRLRFWADPDSTTIAWLGKKRPAINALGFFFDHELREPSRLAPEPIVGQKPALLEIADLVAYVSQRGLSRCYNAYKQRFKTLYESVQPELLTFTRGPDGGFGVSVPNGSLEQWKA